MLSLTLSALCVAGRTFLSQPESIERFIEDEAFPPSYDLAPPRPLPPYRVSQARQNTETEKDLVDEGGGGELNHTMARKPGHLYIIEYSLVTDDERGGKDPNKTTTNKLWASS